MRLTLLMLFTLVPFLSYTQVENDSVQSGSSNSYYLYSDRSQLLYLDTSIQNFEDYNFIYRKGIEYRNLGNLGSAHYPIALLPGRTSGFDDGLNHLDLYKLEWDSMRLYNLSTPYAEIRYVLGLNAESMFSASHGQRINPNIDIGVDFHRINSKGIFKRQENLHNAFTLYTRFRSDNKRYEAIAKALMNDIKTQENGGMEYDIYDTAATVVNKAILDVELNNAVTQIDELGFGIEQSYSLGFKYERIIDTVKISEWIPTFVFNYDVTFRRNKFRFRDNDVNPDYYQEFGLFGDSLEFRQRHTHFHQKFSMANTGIRLADGKPGTIPLIFQAGISHDYHILTQRLGRDFTNITIDGGVSSNDNDDSRLIYEASSAFTLSGYNKGDLLLDGRIGYKMGRAGQIETGVRLIRKEPDYIFQRLESEVFWNNSFDKSTNFTYSFRYTLSKYQLNASVRYSVIGNYLYYNSEARPEQLGSNLNMLVINLRKDFRLGKKIHLDNSILFQLYSEGSDVISMPEIYSKHSLYFLGPLFKEALLASFGIDVRINSSYFLPGYFPVIGSFYVQENYEQDAYPAIDAFINLKIDRLRLFFKVNNITQGLFQNGYYSSIYYPFDERSFRFGLNWRFFD